VDTRTDTKGRKQPAKRAKAKAKQRDDGGDGGDGVAEPAEIRRNLLDSIDRAKAIARAYKKVLKVASLDQEAKVEISDALGGLISLWQSLPLGAVRKPAKPDPRIIAPELADRVGRFAHDLILSERLLARELANIIMLPGVRERLSADLTNGLALMGNDADDPEHTL
jgi:hypothetical protein